MKRINIIAAVISWALLGAVAHADPMVVRRLQRPFRQTMVVRSEGGSILANGEFSQTVEGDMVTMHLIYHFLDGSMDEETTTYRQQNTFQLVRDHHVQQGPFFTRPFDFEVDADAKTATSWTTDSNGAVNINTRDMRLPPDLANGFIGSLLLNAAENTKAFNTEMVVPFNGGRLVRLRVSRENGLSLVSDGKNLKVTVYRIHPNLGGFIGVLAGLLGLKPKDVNVWITQGDEPVVIRTIGQLGGYGPVVIADVKETSFTR
ncbi:hypothetical protein [Silvibacterium acidisoli]|uniref:hypothetical protein n=1 Tax=Acidobacteriaceae bacterium ZG23-2 TaxID=2883246 RepID=UPI00406D0233